MTGTTVTKARAERERKRLADRSRRTYAAGAEIGSLPPVLSPKRKLLCKYDLLLFLQSYFPHSTGSGLFGKGHLRAIARLEQAILRGGRFLNCMPRGFAKSTIVENAILWAVIYGHREYGLILAATEDDSKQALEGIMRELEGNDLLLEDFPEVCYPIRKIEGKSQRCISQTCQGEKTHITWKADTVVLPRIEGSAASEAIIRIKVFNSVRGVRFKRMDGRQARPDFVCVDDPLTDQSAVSPTQTAKMLHKMATSVARLGGHGTRLSIVINATVLADGDMIDQLADHSKHPEWQAIRISMVPRMPTNLDELWLGEYARIRGDYDPEDLDGQEKAHAAATQFYLDNRDAMDEGSEVSWAHIPLIDGEVSALQHAMNILVDDGEAAFLSECQNSPKRQIAAGIIVLEASELLERVNGFERYVVPSSSSTLVFHADVHDAILYYAVAAVGSDFTGAIVDYGTFPKQPTDHFTMYTVRKTLQEELGSDSVEQAVTDGVKWLGNHLCNRAWITPDGDSVPMSLGLFDVGYLPDPVAMGIRLSDFPHLLMGSRGIGIGPSKKPMTDYDMSPKRVRTCGPDKKRPRWFVPKETVGGVPVLQFDANFWKGKLCSRLMQPRNTPGDWALWGNHRTDHSAFVNHLIAEEPVMQTDGPNACRVFRTRPNFENHFWDTSVGCVLGASFKGLQLPECDSIAVQKSKKIESVPRQAIKKSGGLKMKPITSPSGRPFWITAR